MKKTTDFNTLLSILNDYPEIHVEQVKDGKWNFRHDGNEEKPDSKYLKKGKYKTQKEAIKAAFDEYRVNVLGESLQKAAREGRLEEVKKLLEEEGDEYFYDHYIGWAMINAATEGHAEIVDLLCGDIWECPPHWNGPNYIAFETAIENQNIEVIELLAYRRDRWGYGCASSSTLISAAEVAERCGNSELHDSLLAESKLEELITAVKNQEIDEVQRIVWTDGYEEAAERILKTRLESLEDDAGCLDWITKSAETRKMKNSLQDTLPKKPADTNIREKKM